MLASAMLLPLAFVVELVGMALSVAIPSAPSVPAILVVAVVGLTSL